MPPIDFLDDPAQVAPPRAVRIDFDDGSFSLRSPIALQPYARCVGEWLEQWAERTPDALALAERTPDGADWRRVSYAQLRAQVGRLAQALLDLRLPEGAPVVILSDNSIDHAVMMLAAMHIGRPSCSLSSAYSRLTQDHTRLAGMLRLLGPGLIYAADAQVYGPAIAACDLDVPCVFSAHAGAWPGGLAFDTLCATPETPAVRDAFEAIGPETHAKYLMTSGSTGHPKAVINTHRMLCANQQMMAQTWPFLTQEPPVLVDWLPWSHTFGGNHNLNMVLAHGGALYIDEGRPAPGLVEKTARNLREVRPTLWFNVPRGFDMLLPLMEADAALAADILSRLRLAFYAAAALSPATWQRLHALAERVRPGQPLWLTTSWGCTETSPAITSAHWTLDGAGCIGNPLPGMEVRFVPNGGKLEMRIRGVTVTPGYRHQPRETAAAFDAEGYYRIGDAGYLVDAARPERGIVFDGRVAEDFKLGSGTWVSVGPLRIELVSQLAPWVQDLVLTGHDREAVGLLVFPSPQGAAEPAKLREALQAAMRQRMASGLGSARCPTRALVLGTPPDADHGEITDKGYLNQRAVLTRRADAVARLHAAVADAEVIAA
ncbi:trans-feruloyl-CoA synthase [Pseudacidovorax intermedius]|uniref:Trans-feruloyl-CoA synthase n=1 Tax=Pseudacidovorax intermedius TaxID=433924 RepID=A0A370FMN7_9BURK|nr:feruloyl-CoA synthase [Pseudacidovorax intermedius]RDI28986.1 trans-feruloyl-CoA synthase [Pseudacidovorax intermedius]